LTFHINLAKDLMVNKATIASVLSNGLANGSVKVSVCCSASEQYLCVEALRFFW